MTKIEWTEQTWNPITGCAKVSQGCKHCYAETMFQRLVAMDQRDYAGRRFGDVQFHPERLGIPLKRKKPTIWFVNSMSDLFHESVSFEQIDKVFAVMVATPSHTYQVLTKRPERMVKYFDRLKSDEGTLCSSLITLMGKNARGLLFANMVGNKLSLLIENEIPFSNIWLGVSAEDQETFDRRVWQLLKCPAAAHWVSAEPLLGDIFSPLIQKLDWVVVGGESGTNARPMHPDWARSIRDQCADAGVPFFFKQWGGVNKKKAGRLLDGVKHNAMPVIHNVV